jgi:hypothetical protein
MKFYTFRQNNSGGFFIGPKYVIVRANSVEEANEKAEQYAEVYFDGVRDGKDCHCCGNRWYRASEYDGGTDEPQVYDWTIKIPNLNEEISSTFEHEGIFGDQTETDDFHYVP